MTKHFNAWNIKFIWFNPIPLFNLQRLKKVRRDNPNADISLTISKNLLNDNQLEHLSLFCEKNTIKLLYIENLEIQNTEEQKLLGLVYSELHHKNYAAASDILRAMSAFWIASGGSGVYIDLDGSVFIPKIQWKALETDAPYLLPIAVYENTNGSISGHSSNDVIIMPVEKPNLSLDQEIIYISKNLYPVQKRILESYNHPLKALKKCTISPHFNQTMLHAKSVVEIKNNIKNYPFDLWVKSLFQKFCHNFEKENPLLQLYLLNLSYSEAKEADDKILKTIYDSFMQPIRQEGINDETALSNHFKSERDKILIKFTIETSGTRAWVSEKTTFPINANVMMTMAPEQALAAIGSFLIPIEQLSLYSHGLGMYYIGSSGSHSSMIFSLEDQKNITPSDISWLDSGAKKIQAKSEEIAFEIFNRHFNKNKFLSKIRERNKRHIFSPPPLQFSQKPETLSDDLNDPLNSSKRQEKDRRSLPTILYTVFWIAMLLQLAMTGPSLTA